MATITFGSNNASVQGTPGDDSMVGNDPTGNINDVIYGHQGNDTITTTDGLFDSTVYGGQGNDTISDGDPTSSQEAGGNVIYGNLGNDSITSEKVLGDTIYGGQGNPSSCMEERAQATCSIMVMVASHLRQLAWPSSARMERTA